MGVICRRDGLHKGRAQNSFARFWWGCFVPAGPLQLDAHGHKELGAGICSLNTQPRVRERRFRDLPIDPHCSAPVAEARPEPVCDRKNSK